MSDCQSQSLTRNIVYIVSRNLRASHIEKLASQLTQKQIPVQYHNDYQCLGVPLDRRYFIVVDNLEGTVALSSWFTSLLLYIVGYPKRGQNKKNHYCAKPAEVIDKYLQFCALPQFQKRNYLCSQVTSRSRLKSSNSFASMSKTMSIFSNDNKNSQSESKSLNKNFTTKLNEKSKLFLFASSDDSPFNKWTLKIVASNPKKFEIVQNQNDLKLALSVSRTKINYLLISSVEYKTINLLLLKDLQIIIFQRNQQNIQKSGQILGICKKHTEIIQMIRQIGFQVVSLKDIDKSIVKYGNPFAKQVKNKSKKRILWGKDSQSQKSVESYQNKKSELEKPETLNHITVNSKVVFQPMTASAPNHISCSSTSKADENNSGVPDKERKRLSIQSQVRKNQKNIEKAIKVDLSQKMEVSITKPLVVKTKTEKQNILDPLQKKDETKIAVQIIPNLNITQEKKVIRKIKRVRYSKSLHEKKVNEEVKQSKAFDQYKCQAQQQKLQGIENQIISRIPKEFQSQSSFAQSLDSNHVHSLVLKEIKRNSDTLSFPESINFNTKACSQVKQRKQIKLLLDEVNIQQPTINYKKKLLDAQQSLLRKRTSQIGQNKQNFQACLPKDLSQYVLLWKQFNFQVENCKEHLLKALKGKILRENSFYSPNQFGQMLKFCKNLNIIIFLDEVDLQLYANLLQNYLTEMGVTHVYIFEKEGKIIPARLQNIQIALKPASKEAKVTFKPVEIGNYTDGSLLTAREISSWFLSKVRI